LLWSREVARPWKFREQDVPELAGRCALVTGAASGIGFETARALAQHGAEVLLVDRNEEAGRAAAHRIQAMQPGASVRFCPLDLGCQRAVREFAAALVSDGRPLDLLINNAGIQPISQRRTTTDGFELTFGIGHLGHFALTCGLMPLLSAAERARVVTVSSFVHKSGRFDWDDLQMARGYFSQRAYNQTKLANLIFARELNRRLEATRSPVRSLAAHPGVARTGIGANRAQLGRFDALDHLITAILAVVMPVLGQPAQAGALPTLFAATSPHAQGGGFYGPGGAGEMRGPPREAAVSPYAQDLAVARRLWAISEELTGVRYEGLASD
jgi:NAD(P)-dependent dehydrogenase (short-subunit alcohol dehydrogenase family)